MNEFNFDPKAIAEVLPPAGRQSAEIADIRFSGEGGDATWMTLEFQLASGHILDHLVCIAAAKDSPHTAKVPEGAATVRTLCDATERDISTMTSRDVIRSAFIGATVDVTVAIKRRDGYDSASIRRILIPQPPTQAPASTAVEQKT